jgi:hypothetical protein
MMWTSAGRYFSKAARSGALTEVWPETMAPILVAVRKGRFNAVIAATKILTRTILLHDIVEVFSLHRVDDEVALSRDEVSITHRHDSLFACRKQR